MGLAVVRAQEVAPPSEGHVLDCSSVRDGWDVWWHYHQDLYLRERHVGRTGTQSVAVLTPTQRREIATSLHRTLAAAEDPFLRAICLQALARIGIDQPESPLGRVFRQHLGHADRDVREHAVLALGLSDAADADDLALLVGLVRDDAVGRAACGGEVPERCRCFASYGLGRLAFGRNDPVWQRRVLEALRERLVDERSSPDLQVAAIWGLGLMRAPTTLAGRAVHREALQAMDTFFAAPSATPLVRANVPPAIARLLGRGHAAAQPYLRQWLDALQGRAGGAVDEHPLVAQALVLAIGALAQSHADGDAQDDGHRRASERLRELQRTHPDRLTRCVALLGLGRIGGDGNRHVLLEALASARDDQESGWCALALGLSVHGEHGPGRDAAASVVGASLLAAFERSKRPTVGAFAVALGLSGTSNAVAALRTRLRDHHSKHEDAACHCVHGLTLLGDAEAIPLLRATLAGAARLDTLREELAMALHQLGDDEIVAALATQLGAKPLAPSTMVGITRVLGYVGGAPAAAPLQQLLLDTTQTPLVRALAAHALGTLGASQSESWHRALAAAVHSRAVTPTLTNKLTGVLDLW